MQIALFIITTPRDRNVKTSFHLDNYQFDSILLSKQQQLGKGVSFIHVYYILWGTFNSWKNSFNIKMFPLKSNPGNILMFWDRPMISLLDGKLLWNYCLSVWCQNVRLCLKLIMFEELGSLLDIICTLHLHTIHCNLCV